MTTRPDRFTWLEGDLVPVDDESEIDKNWDESKHPRHPRGSAQGGEFASGGVPRYDPKELAGDMLDESRSMDKMAEAFDSATARFPNQYAVQMAYVKARDGYRTAADLFRRASRQFELGNDLRGEDLADRAERKAEAVDVYVHNNRLSIPRLKSDNKNNDDVEKTSSLTITATIEKFDEDKRLVTGWASLADIHDRQDDTISEDEIVKMAHQFMSIRAGKALHAGSRIGDIVESVVFTKALQQGLGIDLGKVGWLITMKVHDDKVWDLVKKGELAAFSIGGRGIRELIDDAE